MVKEVLTDTCVNCGVHVCKTNMKHNKMNDSFAAFILVTETHLEPETCLQTRASEKNLL